MKTKTQYKTLRRGPSMAQRAMDACFALFGRPLKSLPALLEQDAVARAERLRQLEDAILLPLQTLQPAPALVPVEAMPEAEPFIDSPDSAVVQELSSISVNTDRQETARLPITDIVQQPSKMPTPVTVKKTELNIHLRRNYQSDVVGLRVRRRII